MTHVQTLNSRRHSCASRVRRIQGLVIVAIATSGCSAGPIPTLRTPDVPASFEQAIPADVPIWPASDWWKGFASAELDSLIAAAQTENLSLAAAEARVVQADARVRQAGASLLPTVGVGFDALKQASGKSDVTSGCVSSSRFSFGLCASASYEFDFWGRNRALLTNAKAARKATRADRETVALAVLSGTASTYFQLLSVRERLAIAHLNLENAQTILTVSQERARAGRATPLELEQQLATVADQQGAIPRLAQEELETRAALALLAGRIPEAFNVEAQDLGTIKTIEVAPGLPSELLVRRPDIVTSEANLQAAHANLAAVRASLLPAITLTGAGGFQSVALGDLFSASSATYSIGASLIQAVFDSGKRAAQGAEASAAQTEALAGYRSTVMAAFADVEASLGSIKSLADQERIQGDQVTHLQNAFDIAQMRFKAGIDPYLNVLDTQRSLYGARDQLAEIRLARLQSVVGLYKALGGGWHDSEITALAQRAQ